MASEDLFDFSEDIIPSTLEPIMPQDELNAEVNEKIQHKKTYESDTNDSSVNPNFNDSEAILNESNITKESAKIDKTQKSFEPKQIQLPLSKIRSIMKLDPDLTVASGEAIFAVTKAAEMFIDSLAKESYSFTNQAKKKTIQKRDVTLAISSIDSLIFLEGAME